MSHVDYLRLRQIYSNKSLSDYDDLKASFEGRRWIDVKKEIAARGETFRINKVGEYYEGTFDNHFEYRRHNVYIGGPSAYEYIWWHRQTTIINLTLESKQLPLIPERSWDDVLVVEYTGRG